MPTSPPILALDTRTQREFPDIKGPPRLMNRHALDGMRVKWSKVAAGNTRAAIFLSPTPVCGFKPVEEIQRFLTKLGLPVRIVDNESWVSNPDGYGALMHGINWEFNPDIECSSPEMSITHSTISPIFSAREEVPVSFN